jgi:hypothetical protein
MRHSQDSPEPCLHGRADAWMVALWVGGGNHSTLDAVKRVLRCCACTSELQFQAFPFSRTSGNFRALIKLSTHKTQQYRAAVPS